MTERTFLPNVRLLENLFNCVAWVLYHRTIHISRGAEIFWASNENGALSAVPARVDVGIDPYEWEDGGFRLFPKIS